MKLIDILRDQETHSVDFRIDRDVARMETRYSMYVYAMDNLYMYLRDFRYKAIELERVFNGISESGAARAKMDEARYALEDFQNCYRNLKRFYQHASVLKELINREYGALYESEYRMAEDDMLKKMHRRIVLDFLTDGKISWSTYEEMYSLPRETRNRVLSALDGKDCVAIFKTDASECPAAADLDKVDCDDLYEQALEGFSDDVKQACKRISETINRTE